MILFIQTFATMLLVTFLFIFCVLATTSEAVVNNTDNLERSKTATKNSSPLWTNPISTDEKLEDLSEKLHALNRQFEVKTMRQFILFLKIIKTITALRNDNVKLQKKLENVQKFITANSSAVNAPQIRFQEKNVRDAEMSDAKAVVYAVNCGGRAHVDSKGVYYEQDPLHGVIGSEITLLINIPIYRIEEQDYYLYRSIRFHTSSFGYDIPILLNGTYTLILKFIEGWFHEAGSRIFGITLNRKHTVVEEFDLISKAPFGFAHDEYITFTKTGNQLEYKGNVSNIINDNIRVDFLKIKDNPMISAISLMRANADEIQKLEPIYYPTF